MQHCLWVNDVLRVVIAGCVINICPVVAYSDPHSFLMMWQVIDELERNHYSPMLKYTATDITAGFGPNLLQTVRNPKVDFKVWDVNKPAPKEIGGPFDLILASNAIHACDNMQGEHRPLNPYNSIFGNCGTGMFHCCHIC